MKTLVNDGGISTRNPSNHQQWFATNLLNTNIVHLKGNQLHLHTQNYLHLHHSHCIYIFTLIYMVMV